MIVLYRFAVSWVLSWLGIVLLAHTAQAQSSSAIIRDTELENALRVYLHGITQTHPDIDVRFLLVQSPSANAFVVQGNTIYVHLGLWDVADTPSMMTGVLAHELGHILSGHASLLVEDIDQSAQRGAYALAAALPIALATQSFAIGAILGLGSAQTAQAVVFERQQAREFDADRLAVDLMTSAQQSPHGLLDFFRKLETLQRGTGLEEQIYLSTHPATTRRLRLLEEATALSPPVEPDEVLVRLHARARAKARAASSPRHVMNALYPLEDDSEAARYGRAYAAYIAQDAASSRADLDALSSAYPHDPFILELAASLAVLEHDHARAVDFYQRALEKLEWAAQIQLALADTYLGWWDVDPQPWRLDEAERILARARFLDEPPLGWYFLLQAKLYERRGAIGQRELAMTEHALLRGDIVAASRHLRGAEENVEAGRDMANEERLRIEEIRKRLED